MLRRRVHICPSFQLGKLLSNSIHKRRIVAPQTVFVRDRIPIVRGVTISRSGIFRDIEHCADRGGEDEAFEGGRVLSGGLEDGERSGDGGFELGFGEGGTWRGFVW